ncbi:hypothetical protein [Sphingomonas sp. 1P08PE]|uniref:hypothetical protein n=1 Tax=Sphingomonas sp. 1P08PE TaxID=554122 RepID=UPI0039A20F0B
MAEDGMDSSSVYDDQLKVTPGSLSNPRKVSNSELPDKNYLIGQFNSKIEKGAKSSGSTLKPIKQNISSCSIMDSLVIGANVINTDGLNGRAALLSCLDGNATVTAEVFDYSKPTDPAMSSKFRARLDYVDFANGKLLSTYMASGEGRKFYIFEWIGEKKSVTLSILGEVNASPLSLKDTALAVVSELAQ